MVDKIKIFYTDDESLKLLGELLGNETSRSIIKILSEKPYYTQEISNKLDFSVSRIINHLKKLEELGLVDIIEKPIVKGGVKRRFFKINNSIFISKLTKEKTEKKGILGKIFRDGVKISTLVITSAFTWVMTNKTQKSNIIFDRLPYNAIDFNFELLIPVLVICLSLFLVWFSKKYK